MIDPQRLLNKAEEEGYNFLLQSGEELVFFKSRVPKLSRDGFFAGCTVTSERAIAMLENGSRDNLEIRWEENS